MRFYFPSRDWSVMAIDVMQPVCMIISIFPVDNIMDEIEGKDAISVISQCADKRTAELVRLAIAKLMPHGTRLVIIETEPSTQSVVVDTLIVVMEDIN